MSGSTEEVWLHKLISDILDVLIIQSNQRGHIWDTEKWPYKKSDLLNSYEIFTTGKEKWLSNTGDCLIEVTAWAGSTVFCRTKPWIIIYSPYRNYFIQGFCWSDTNHTIYWKLEGRSGHRTRNPTTPGIFSSYLLFTSRMANDGVHVEWKRTYFKRLFSIKSRCISVSTCTLVYSNSSYIVHIRNNSKIYS